MGSSILEQLQIVESTLDDNASFLLGYVQFVYNMLPQKDIIFTINLPTNAQALSIFNAEWSFYEEKDF